MRGIFLVARRDFAAYVNTYWGWGILALALVIDGILFNVQGLGRSPKFSAEVLQQFFYLTGGLTLIVSVPVTMRLFAEERQTGTMVLLETSPLSDRQLVLGKYLSGMAFVTAFAVFTSYLPAFIFVNGKVGTAEIAVGYLGILLMGSAGVAIGTWASAVSRNQIFAAVLGAVGITFFVVCWMLAGKVDAPFKAVISYLSFFEQQFQPFQQGRLNTEGVVFFLSVTFGFLLMATQSLCARRWR
jgi:ABC-2 type transport system permease protein